MESLDQLVNLLARLPGIGRKSAQRLAFHIISMDEADVAALSSALTSAKQRVHYCPVCGNYTEDELCSVCSDPKRDRELVCVVENARDVMFMERIHEFRGRYHVLGGVLSPMDGIGPDSIRIQELIDRVQADGVSEVILATNPDVEGEATASYIAKQLKPLGVRVSRIAHGIPIGGNLEYVDEITLLKSIENRRDM